MSFNGFARPPDLHSCKVDRYHKECASIKNIRAFVVDSCLSIIPTTNNYEHNIKRKSEIQHENSRSRCALCAAYLTTHIQIEMYQLRLARMFS